MSRRLRRLASQWVSGGSRLLPPHLSPWSRAMARELAEIGDDGEALRFAAGCLAATAALAIAHRLRSIGAILFPLSPSTRSLPTMNDFWVRPRVLGLVCAAGAVGMGLACMLAAGAPSLYLLVNLAALVLGATAWLALGRSERSPLSGAGPAMLALAALLLLTALFGDSADGATRWVSVGPLNLQVSLIVLPVMLVLYARRPDSLGTAAMIAAAVALALQPDRAMAGALLAGLLATLCARPGRLQILAAAASALAFGWTLAAPDRGIAVAHVDLVLYTAFDVHPLAGLAVTVGAAALVVPALVGLWKGAGERAALLAFGGCWSGAVAAAALGNYPTPLVGYGGSAVLGYLLSVSLLPNGARAARREGAAPPAEPAPGDDRALPELRIALAGAPAE